MRPRQVRQVPDDCLDILVHQVLRHLGDDRGAHPFRQSLPQQAEKHRSAHHYQSFEITPAVRLLELRRDTPRKDFRFMPARGLFTTGRMMRRRAATTRNERGTIELAARAVGREVPVVQMCKRIRQAAYQFHGVMWTGHVVEARLALIGDNEPDVHGLYRRDRRERTEGNAAECRRASALVGNAREHGLREQGGYGR